MGEFLIEWLSAVWMVLVESGPYLLVGFAIAGLLAVLVPATWVARRLGGDDVKSVATASLIGVPVPLCSCSVIPTATQLRRSGASRGATTAFLISTPETGVDSIGATWALMDPLMTVVRPVAAFATAFAAGISVNLFGRDGSRPPLDRPADAPRPGIASGPGIPAESSVQSSVEGVPAVTEESGIAADAGDCCAHMGATPAATPPPVVTPEDDAGCCAHPTAPVLDDHGHDHSAPSPTAPLWRRALHYAFGTLLDDLTPWFVIGFAVSGLIVVAVPDGFFEGALFTGWTAMLAMLIAGVPLYVCATASTPIAAAMMAKGLEPGAALVFLLAGPATNVATMLVVRDLLGKRALALYLASIAVMSLVLGSIVNRLYPLLGFDPRDMDVTPGAMDHGLVATVSGIVLAVLLARSAWRIGLGARYGAALRRFGAPVGFDPTAAPVKALAFAAVALAYAATALSVVGPGETVFVERFGRVVAERSEPGRILHAPWPFSSARRVSTSRVRTLEFGVDRKPLGDEVTDSASLRAENARLKALAAEAEMMTGDGAFVAIEYAVQFRVADARAWAYGFSDPEALVGRLTQEAVRRATAERTTVALLVPPDDTFDRDVEARLAEALDRAGLGVELCSIELLSVHAPPAVHGAYRRVASALVDAQTAITIERWKATQVETEARIQAAKVIAQATADAQTTVAAAKGATAALVSLDGVWRESPESARTLIHLTAWREAATLSKKTARDVLAILSKNVQVLHGGAAPLQSFFDGAGQAPRSPR